MMMLMGTMIHIDIMERYDGGKLCHIMTHKTKNAMEMTGRMKVMKVMKMMMMIAMMTVTMTVTMTMTTMET